MTPDGRIVVSHTRGDALGTSSSSRIATERWRIARVTHRRLASCSIRWNWKVKVLASGAARKLLVARGLYPKEAKAMVESWRGSWFEQGTRLFYIVSNEAVDAILPLQV